MSLYNHVANKDDILDGIVEIVWRDRAFRPATRLEGGIRRHGDLGPRACCVTGGRAAS